MESKTKENTNIQLDLQQHICLNDTNKNDLIDNRATKKARLITGELKNHKVSNDIPDNQKVPENQVHIDSQNLQKRNKTASQSTTMAAHLGISSSPKDRPNEQLKPHQANIQTNTEKTANTKKYSWLMRTITKIVNTPATRMRQHKCKFENNIKAAKHNKKMVKTLQMGPGRSIEKTEVNNDGNRIRVQRSRSVRIFMAKTQILVKHEINSHRMTKLPFGRDIRRDKKGRSETHD